MNVRRIEFSDAPLEAIDRLAGDHFFSSTSFARLWQKMAGNPVYWVLEESSKTLAILPGVEFGKKPLRRLQAAPNGCYGKILYDDKSLLENKISEALINRIGHAGYCKIFLNDFYNTMIQTDNFDKESVMTHLVNISSADWQPPDSKLRQQIHKAEKEGVQMEPFKASRHMKGFMNLVKLHERRRNTKCQYTQAFFEALADVSVKDDRVHWVWCEHEAQAVASSIFLRQGNAILHWQMYYDEAMAHLQATKLIPYMVAKQAAQRGNKLLNLGASPPGAEGAEFYKSKWGGKFYNYNCYVYKSFLGRLW